MPLCRSIQRTTAKVRRKDLKNQRSYCGSQRTMCINSKDDTEVNQKSQPKGIAFQLVLRGQPKPLQLQTGNASVQLYIPVDCLLAVQRPEAETYCTRNA